VRWDFIVEHWLARLVADPALISVMGSGSGWIGPSQASKPVKVPSIEYTLVYDTEAELFNRIGVQVDLWARGLAKAGQIERRVRRLTHRTVAQELGGERLWMRYQDSRTLDYPNDPGVFHRQVDFEFEAVVEEPATP
jgi:hypothetical protein